MDNPFCSELPPQSPSSSKPIPRLRTYSRQQEEQRSGSKTIKYLTCTSIYVYTCTLQTTHHTLTSRTSRGLHSMTCHVGGFFLGTSSLRLGRAVAPLVVPLGKHMLSNELSKKHRTLCLTRRVSRTIVLGPCWCLVFFFWAALCLGARPCRTSRTVCDWAGSNAVGLYSQSKFSSSTL